MVVSPFLPQDPPPPAVQSELSHWMFESSPDCVKLLDLEGRLQAMNRNGQCVMEVEDFGPLCGAGWATLWPAHSRERIEAALDAARQGQPSRFQAFCPTAKGTPRWWDVSVTPVTDADGAVRSLLSVSRDISAVVQAQEESREAAARLRFTLDSAEIGDWELDLLTGASRRSLQHDRCFGYAEPVADWSVERFLGHVHPMDREHVQSSFAQALERREPWRVECRVLWPDASVHWISIHGSLYVDDQGAPTRLLGIVMDTSARRRSTALAEGQRQALELAVADAPTEEILARLARTAEASAGSDAKVSVLLCDGGSHMRHGAAPSLPPGFARAIDGLPIGAEVGSCGAAAFLRKPVVAADVQTHPNWVDFRELAQQHGLRACWSQPILSSAGKVLGTVAAYHAQPHEPGESEREAMAMLANTAALILERQAVQREQEQVQSALRDSEQRFRSLVEATASIVWTTSAHGRFGEAQAGWVAYTGQDPAAAAGNGWLDAVHPEDRAPTMAAWQDAVARRQPCHMEHRVRRLDGEYRFLNMRAVPILDGGGAVREWVGIHVDMTDIRRAEQDLRRLAAELAEADRRKSEFLATLAHELRNPLAPIRNGLEILRRSGDQPATVQKLRQMLTRQVQHMVRLVDDLLDVARISRGKLELKKEAVQLRELLAAAVEASQPLVDSGRHSLSVHEPDEPLVLNADATRITQVISNLLNNAARYTPPGGRIAVTVRRAGEAAEIEVADNGIGLTQESLDRIFEMFTQVGGPAQRAHGGLGIGLTLARELVQLHGGQLRAHSAGLGQGASFVVRLPLVAQQEMASAPAALAAAGEPVPALRILVVDDNVDAGETLAGLLELQGHAVRTVASGADALRLAPQLRPDVVFLDIGMPGMDGYEVARALRQMGEARDTVLVALTGWGAKEDRARAFAAGFDRHLTKPADPDQLTELIARMRQPPSNDSQFRRAL